MQFNLGFEFNLFLQVIKTKFDLKFKICFKIIR